ncbi:MAG TPA: RodZ domain-containing protein [Candidatus Methylacidiphilales bacterium]|jgi:cytoskeletal protein RodZ|nr:RodZ domain-containing protein [Candidatus Methylacidiphilales bacterium]
MKTVGKQLQEARLAKNWTPELAARETKIKVDRLRDLEADDYSHFTSPTYARGFVRTYARALGLDEYRILRQLDNKLPDDDSANIVTDGGVAYLPETAMPPRVAHRDFTGLYIVMGLGAVVTLAILFVLFEAYRVGELSRWFASSPEPAATSATNAVPAMTATDAPLRARPIDSDTPPPIIEATNTPPETAPVASAAPAAADASAVPAPVSPRALPVDDSAPAASPGDNTAPVQTPKALSVDDSAPAASADNNTAPVQAPKALPVDDSVPAASADNNTAPVQAPRALPVDASGPADAAPVPPRALPVDPSDLAHAAAPTTVALNETNAISNPPAPPVAPPVPSTTSSARQSNSGPVVEPSTESPPVVPVAPAAATNAAPQAAAPAAADANSGKRLVLTASQDSFVRVTDLDSPDPDKPLYAAVLHSGQSIGFDGRKFSINVGIPSAVDVKLDGVNYGPHSDQEAPETFVVESRLP